MRDHKKFCLPKLIKYPTLGDIMIRLKNGETGVVTPKEYEKIKSFFLKIGEYEVLEIGEPENLSTQTNYVEIGGVKWATMNVGATSITDTGLYFQWGDTQGYTAEQVGSGEGLKYFSEEDCIYYNDGSYTKYNEGDSLITLESTDDAVKAAWGGNWRMPTVSEFIALGEAVTSAWTADYQGSGVAGIICTDKTDSSKVLFFPACGYAYYGSVSNVGNDGHYWSSSHDADYGDSNAYYLYFNNGDADWVNYNYRCYGYPVRGILDE